MMKAVKRSRICSLNEHLTCKICEGYFIDATTIVECLHTFCRSCIVKYLESNKYCPVCEVQVHKSKPLLSIKRDKTIQDVVYKLVPRLFQNEMQRRKAFYEKHPESKPSPLEQTVESQYQYLLAPEESISLTLNYFGCNTTPRYLKCPAAVSIGHLHKLIRAKYDLSLNHRVEVFFNEDSLNPSLTLMDVAYIYLAKKKCPIDLLYRIYECTTKKVKSEDVDGKETNKESNQNNNTWREVQLRISENGEMSITGIHDDLLKIVENEKNVPVSEAEKSDTKVEEKKAPPGLPVTTSSQEKISDSVEKPAAKKEVPPLKYIGKTPLSTAAATNVKNIVSTQISTVKTSIYPTTTSLSATTTTVFTTINSTKCSTKSDDTVPLVKLNNSSEISALKATETKLIENVDKPIVNNNNNNASDRKRKSDTFNETEPKPKQIILNHSIGFLNLSNNHPLKKHSLTNRNGDSETKEVSNNNTVSTESKPVVSHVEEITVNVKSPPPPPPPVNKHLSGAQLNRPGTPIPPTPQKTNNIPCYMPKSNLNPVLNVPKPVKNDVRPAPPKSTETKISPPTTSTSSTNIAPPKPVVKSKPSSPIGYKTLRDPPKSWNSQISKANLSKCNDPKYSDLKNVRPPKFFKMRNNMPRYLGNPASGVKPMYQVQTSSDKEKNAEASKSEKNNEIKRHSIVKIDPKTLKPISEKAPDDTSLSIQNSTKSVTTLVESKPSLSVVETVKPQTDLKINTSSVSIFNPLKNHSSPKNDRKSPKSPITTSQNSVKTTVNSKPKMTSTANTTPSTPTNSFPKLSPNTASKRDSKPNLSFTPANPFIPNLASPTINPNQFLFPGPHSGLPAYDPRLVAAYHQLWYGQRMAFSNAAMATLNLDLNQRKIASETNVTQTSPKLGLPPIPPPSPQLPSKSQTRPNTSTSNFPIKKPQKESSKIEKSLHTTVEKLVQNRTKEIVRNNEILSQIKTEETSSKEKPQEKVTLKDTNSDSKSEVCSEKNNSSEVKQNNSDNKANVDASTGEGCK